VRHLLVDGGEAIADLALLRDQREVYGPVASTLTAWRRILGEPCGPGLAIELHEALDPLAPHLVPAGREAILLQGARIALADGPYTPAERETLAAVGAALTICADDVTRLLTAARTPS
jgi:Tellurite resistance protein TerB